MEDCNCSNRELSRKTQCHHSRFGLKLNHGFTELRDVNSSKIIFINYI